MTISSLDFGYPMEDFGPEPTTFSGLTLVRSGGHFWGAQTFGAIWMFSASKKYTGIRVSDVEIIDPTYSGIMFQTKYNGAAENTFQDTVLSNVSISGARKSGDAFDAKSGFGLWANEMPEAGQGPAGRCGHVQRPAVQQQLPGHQEHHHDLHDQHQLISLPRRTIQ